MPSKTRTPRWIRTIPGNVDKQDITELARQLQEMIYELEGRRGPISSKDGIDIDAEGRHTAIKFKGGTGERGVGSLSFGGSQNSSMFLAKGAHQDDDGNWVADDNTAVIQEMQRDSVTPLMYRNTGLIVGRRFQPTPVGYVGVTTSPNAPGGFPPPSGGGGGSGPSTPIDEIGPRKPFPHTHAQEDVLGDLEDHDVLHLHQHPHRHPDPDLSKLELQRAKPHTHPQKDLIEPAVQVYSQDVLQGLSHRLDVVNSETVALAAYPPAPLGNVTWTNVTGCSVDPLTNKLTRTLAGADLVNAGARSQQVIASGDGYVQFKFTGAVPGNGIVGFGLGYHAATSPSYLLVNFLMYCYAVGSQLLFFTEGVAVGGVFALATNDVMKISVTGGVVSAFQNGVLRYTFLPKPIYPMSAHAVLYDSATPSVCENAIISGNPAAVLTATALPTRAPHVHQYRDLVGDPDTILAGQIFGP